MSFSINVSFFREVLGPPSCLHSFNCTEPISLWRMYCFCDTDKDHAETLTPGQISSIKKERCNPTPMKECTQSLLLFLVTYSSLLCDKYALAWEITALLLKLWGDSRVSTAQCTEFHSRLMLCGLRSMWDGQSHSIYVLNLTCRSWFEHGDGQCCDVRLAKRFSYSI